LSGGLVGSAVAVMLVAGFQVASGSLAARRASSVLQLAGTWLGISPLQTLLIANGVAFAIAARSASGDGPHAISPLATPLWLAAIVIVILGCRIRHQTSSAIRWTRVEIAGLSLLTLAALALRAWGIGQMPFVLNGDEGSAGLTAWEFLTGVRNNVLSLGWFSFPGLYFGLLSLFQVVFGRTMEAVRLLSALTGALTIPFLYAAVRSMFGRPAAWASAAWLGALHIHVFFSRVAYNNIFDPLLLVLAVTGLWQGWREGRRAPFLTAGLALGLSQFFYTTGRLTPVILALWTLLLAMRRRPDRARLSGLAGMLLVAAVVVLPLGLLYAQHPDQLLFTASRVSLLVPGLTAEAAAALGTSVGGLILEQIWITTLGLTVAELQGVYYEPGVPMLISLSAVLFLIGLGLCALRLRDPRYSLPLLIMAGGILAGGLSIQAPNSQRLLYLTPALAMVVGLPFGAVWTWSTRRRPVGRMALVAVGAALLGVMIVQNLDALFVRYFPREEYGSLNEAVTQEMAAILPYWRAPPRVYFLGGERMISASIPNLAYLVPDAMPTVLTSAGDVPDRATGWIAIVLPEEGDELTALRRRFPEGTGMRRYNRHGTVLFDIWAVDDAATALRSLP